MSRGGLALAHALERAISQKKVEELEVVVYEQRKGMSIYPTDLASI